MKSAIIVAGGESSRFEKNKIFASLYGKTLIENTVGSFWGIADEIVLVANPKDMRRMELLFEGKGIKLTEGGHTRTQSVLNGLDALSKDSAVVAIHDGARPYVSQKLVKDCFDAALCDGSAIPVVHAVDTVYLQEADAVKFVAKDKLCNVQTPQTFLTNQIKQAYAKRDAAKVYTDDSQVYLDCFGKIRFVEGERQNIKITYPSDLYGTSIGNGFDVHPLTSGRKLILGGVEIPHDKGLDGHSDADVAVHAVMDAVLCGIGERDIGVQFPDTDDRHKDACSITLLQKVAELVKNKKAAVQSVSCVIMAQEPKLAAYIPQMCLNISRALGIPQARVNISATTTEKLGIIGEGKGIAAQAVCITQLF